MAQYLAAILDSQAVAATIKAVAVILASVCVGAAIVYKAIQKVRFNARQAKEREEEIIQQRVTNAVDLAKKDMLVSIEMSQQVASHWHDMADVFEKERNHERESHEKDARIFEAELKRLRDDREDLTAKLNKALLKIEEIVDLNLSYQGQINDNARQLAELQEKVKAIDGNLS